MGHYYSEMYLDDMSDDEKRKLRIKQKEKINY